MGRPRSVRSYFDRLSTNGRFGLSGSLNTFSNLDSSNRSLILTLRQASFGRLRTEQGERIAKEAS
ncbi:MAG: hypothetical protein LBD67_11055 [Candidatus Accumulibacter sp.]|nr:hypothetical protein [Accumulibacter sp.]